MEFYHVLNRGVEKRDIAMDDHDRLRFVHDLYVFNDKHAVAHPKTTQRDRKRERLVTIHAWCLMKNHYHLLLSPTDDDLNNMSLFMKKLNGGYAKYFNERHSRTGYLWQGKFKRIHIQRDAHFIHIPYYIHLNPLDYTHPKWRTGEIKNPKKVLTDLRTYRWSSFLDYTDTKNFPSVISTRHIKGLLKSRAAQEKEIANIITDADIATNAAILE